MEKGPELVAASVILDARDKILLIRQEKWDNTYSCFIGGHVKYGELIGDALRREIHEEVGLDVPAASFSFLNWDEWIVRPPEYERDAHLVFLNFACRIKGPNVHLNSPNEVQEAIWVSLQEARTLVSTKLTYVIDQLMAMRSAGQRPMKANS